MGRPPYLPAASLSGRPAAKGVDATAGGTDRLSGSVHEGEPDIRVQGAEHILKARGSGSAGFAEEPDRIASLYIEREGPARTPADFHGQLVGAARYREFETLPVLDLADRFTIDQDYVASASVTPPPCFREITMVALSALACTP
jgi:hypothetical protein